MHWDAGMCFHATCCNQQWFHFGGAASGSVLFRQGCHSCHIISVRQRQQCLVDKVWMSLWAEQPRGSSRLPVCSSTRTHTHPHCTHSLTYTLCLSVYLSSHTHARTHTHLYTNILTCTYYQKHSAGHTSAGFQALAAVIQDHILPCKYSRSPRLLFITLQCYSLA